MRGNQADPGHYIAGDEMLPDDAKRCAGEPAGNGESVYKTCSSYWYL